MTPCTVTLVMPLLIFAHCVNNCAELMLVAFGTVFLTICVILFIAADMK